MFSTITTAAICGMNAVIVHVEVDVSHGLPGFLMVGYLGSEVREAGERVRVALKNSGISLPPMKITVNLSPADIRKCGTGYDLPVAVGILQSLGHVEEKQTQKIMFAGELSLDGEVNEIKGVLPMVKTAGEEGMTCCVVPWENEKEGALIPDMEVIGVTSLREVMALLRGEDPRILGTGSKRTEVNGTKADGTGAAETEVNGTRANETGAARTAAGGTRAYEAAPDETGPGGGSAEIKPDGIKDGRAGEGRVCGRGTDRKYTDVRKKRRAGSLIRIAIQQEREDEREPDFAEICGQAGAKRAAEIAAAGFHNLLLIGPPGAGKTMIARRIPGILPELTREEGLEVSSIYSISGLLSRRNSLISVRPFLSPHHTITAQAFSGGGIIPKPGVISLAHKGVLFLDEMPEFGFGVLDTLRQPLEEKKIQIARLGGSYEYPADFMLVGAMNIATTKLIQCGIAEMPENKAFHGFCGFIFSFFEPVSV